MPARGAGLHGRAELMEIDGHRCCCRPLCERAALLCTGGIGGEARGSSSLPIRSTRVSAVDRNDESEAYSYNVVQEIWVLQRNVLFASVAGRGNQTSLNSSDTIRGSYMTTAL